MSRARGLRVVMLPGHRRAPGSWLGDEVPPVDDVAALTVLVPGIDEHEVFICGPQGWADDVTRTARAAGVPAERIHLESFGW